MKLKTSLKTAAYMSIYQKRHSSNRPM